MNHLDYKKRCPVCGELVPISTIELHISHKAYRERESYSQAVRKHNDYRITHPIDSRAKAVYKRHLKNKTTCKKNK